MSARRSVAKSTAGRTSSALILPSGRSIPPTVISEAQARADQVLRRLTASWQIAGRHVFKGLKRAFLDPEIAHRIPTDVFLDPSKLLSFVPAANWAGARNVAGIFEELGKMKVKFAVHTSVTAFDEVRIRIDVIKPGSLKTWGSTQAGEIPTWRIPRLSGALERATGIEWRFGEGTLTSGDAMRVLRAGQHAMNIEELREAVKSAIPKKSPFAVKPHVPFTMPDLRFGISFRAGRAAGWTHIANEASNLLSIVSFAQFLKGRNPGFLAQVLFTNPLVAIPAAFAINAVVGHFKRKKAKRQAAAAYAQAKAAFEAAEAERAKALRDAFELAKVQHRARVDKRIRNEVLSMKDLYGFLQWQRYGR